MSVDRLATAVASRKGPILSYRQMTYLRTRGAFGSRLKVLGTGRRFKEVATANDLDRIDRIATEYLALLNEFEPRYEHITSGRRWVELGGSL